MKKTSCLLTATLLLGTASLCLAQANAPVTRPPSAQGKAPAPARVRTPLYVRIPANNARFQTLTVNGETPASLACIYGLAPPTNGCPKNGTVLPNGGTKAIAVVEFGTYSNLQSDINTFNAQFGLPNVTVTQICTPAPPCPDNTGTGWDVETALDVEYAHAMAPNAQIIVAEFVHDPFANGTETQAAAAVAAAGGGEVSNSWTECFGTNCAPEDPSELQLDQYFTTPGVVYFASSGDYGWGPAYPSVSPNVVSAGGAAVIRDVNGNFTGENCWWGSGGGRSQYEPSPRYQWIISNLTGPFRGTPDLAAEADPESGVDVYNSSYCNGWCVVGGTSVASPVLAGIVNASGSFHSSTSAELTQTYTEYGLGIGSYNKYFRDIQIGSNGYSAKLGWDQCTGIGSIKNPQGL